MYAFLFSHQIVITLQLSLPVTMKENSFNFSAAHQNQIV